VQCHDHRGLPVYAVGDATAEAVRAAGFGEVIEAAGTLDELNALLAGAGLSPGRKLLHVCGAHVAGAAQAVVPVDRLVVYEARAVERLSSECMEILDGEGFAAALFFSPRTALIFTELLKRAERTAAIKSTKALCLADSVLKSLQDLPWRDVRVAASPDQAAMLALLDHIREDQEKWRMSP
jgi:uroporphyrinogen-III synthase